MDKTLNNSCDNKAEKNVNDIESYGAEDEFELISKTSSKSEGWTKSTKAMWIIGVGCVVQVSTQQGDNIAEATVFVPGTKVVELYDGDGKVIGRRVVKDRNV